jgi:tRNA(fMet)-specific endonuclease VapC
VIALTDADAILAGEILARLENMGQTIGMADTLIAAIAINSRRTLVTANEKHFQRVVQIGYPLSIKNWRLPEQQEELPSG